jgi:hypothetical protein
VEDKITKKNENRQKTMSNMVLINPSMSTVTLNNSHLVNVLMVSTKRDCQNESKNKTKLHFVHKKHTLNIKRGID